MRKKTVTYEAEGWRKFSEEDTYKDGCIPDTGRYDDGDTVFSGTTIEQAILNFVEFFDGKREDCVLNACDEPGRVDLARVENYEGERPTRRQIEDWEKGKEKLWYTVYTIRIQKVTRERVKCKK